MSECPIDGPTELEEYLVSIPLSLRSFLLR